MLMAGRRKKVSMSLKITRYTMGQQEGAKIKDVLVTSNLSPSDFGLLNFATIDFCSKGSCMQDVYVFCINIIHSVF